MDNEMTLTSCGLFSSKLPSTADNEVLFYFSDFFTTIHLKKTSQFISISFKNRIVNYQAFYFELKGILIIIYIVLQSGFSFSFYYSFFISFYYRFLYRSSHIKLSFSVLKTIQEFLLECYNEI